ncbi:MAG TPA: efflux RND transporter periplasmic adaptor subunit [Candidatus Sulfotelmatobacter sp.]|nr:efflux RND transporter periplasmic adaptor subunit [Candidatus Sulfotelmatobacter sp.]
MAQPILTMRRIVMLLVVAAVVGGGIAWYVVREPATATPAARQAPPAVPVLAGTAETRDVQLYLNGLGTVQAFNTVTVKARVDGQLDKIAFVEGQEVKAGDVLAQIDPRPFQAALGQAIANKASDEAKLLNAKLDLQRYSSLVQREFATRQSVDTQNALVAQLDAAIQGDQAMIDNARVQLGYTTITAPLDGRTGVRLIDQGNIVHAGDAGGIVVITQLQPISVIFTLPQDVLDDVHEEMAKGQLKVIANKRDESSVIDEGTLALIDNQIDQTTGTIRLKATFPNLKNALWPGEFVSARLMLGVRRGVVTVPAQVVQRGPSGTYAYVIKPDDTVEMHDIKVLQIRDGIAVISTGLTAGERVVVDGQYKLRPGVRVDTATAGGDKATPKPGA